MSASVGLLAAGIAFMIFLLPLFLILFTIALYIFISLVYYSIGKKTGQSSPGISWIPIIGPPLILTTATGIPFWPLLLIMLISFFLPFFTFVFFLFSNFPTIIYFLFYTSTSLLMAGYNLILHWKTFEKMNQPAWWSILIFVPIVQIIVLWVVAWGKSGERPAPQNTQQQYASPQQNNNYIQNQKQ